MSDDWTEDATGLIVIIVIAVLGFGGCVSWNIGNDAGEEHMKRQAVIVGYAHYTNDNRGNSIWKWNNDTNSFPTTNLINVVTNETTISNKTNHVAIEKED
jgi:hypothetical protein